MSCGYAGVLDRPGLIRRVNQLYHELTGEVFDNEHRYRHQVERPFWEFVAQRWLSRSAAIENRAMASAGGAAHSVSAGRVVVDLACGTGFVSDLLAPWLGTRDRLISIDLGLTPLRLGRARANPASAVRRAWLSADGQTVPLADGSADLVAVNAALHHFPEPERVLWEVDRVLKPGGVFALGFEPNMVHFRSKLAGLVKGLNRAAWYASPRQNWRRLGERLGWIRREGATCGTAADEGGWASRLNGRLMAERRIEAALPAQELLDLVDPHARGADEAGFEAEKLLRTYLPGYAVEWLRYGDFLGELPRRSPMLRAAVDAGLRWVAPRHGSLFCWVVRKPAAEDEVAGC